MLFESNGSFSQLPAAIMSSDDPYYDDNPERLTEQSRRLSDLKGQECSAEMQAFADKLANEHVADLRLPIPTGFTDGKPCLYATLLIPRKHLPGNHLARVFFPVLIAPARTEAVMIVPHWYWDTHLIQFWSRA